MLDKRTPEALYMFYEHIYIYICPLVMKYDFSLAQYICSTETLYVYKNSVDKLLKQKIRAQVEAVITLGCTATKGFISTTAHASCGLWKLVSVRSLTSLRVCCSLFFLLYSRRNRPAPRISLHFTSQCQALGPCTDCTSGELSSLPLPTLHTTISTGFCTAHTN
jgi:hypothetical protein